MELMPEDAKAACCWRASCRTRSATPLTVSGAGSPDAAIARAGALTGSRLSLICGWCCACHCLLRRGLSCSGLRAAPPSPLAAVPPMPAGRLSWLQGRLSLRTAQGGRWQPACIRGATYLNAAEQRALLATRGNGGHALATGQRYVAVPGLRLRLPGARPRALSSSPATDTFRPCCRGRLTSAMKWRRR
jgi:hypothetical protein